MDSDKAIVGIVGIVALVVVAFLGYLAWKSSQQASTTTLQKSLSPEEIRKGRKLVEMLNA